MNTAKRRGLLFYGCALCVEQKRSVHFSKVHTRVCCAFKLIRIYYTQMRNGKFHYVTKLLQMACINSSYLIEFIHISIVYLCCVCKKIVQAYCVTKIHASRQNIIHKNLHSLNIKITVFSVIFSELQRALTEHR